MTSLHDDDRLILTSLPGDDVRHNPPDPTEDVLVNPGHPSGVRTPADPGPKADDAQQRASVEIKVGQGTSGVTLEKSNGIDRNDINILKTLHGTVPDMEFYHLHMNGCTSGSQQLT